MNQRKSTYMNHKYAKRFYKLSHMMILIHTCECSRVNNSSCMLNLWDLIIFDIPKNCSNLYDYLHVPHVCDAILQTFSHPDPDPQVWVVASEQFFSHARNLEKELVSEINKMAKKLFLSCIKLKHSTYMIHKCARQFYNSFRMMILIHTCDYLQESSFSHML